MRNLLKVLDKKAYSNHKEVMAGIRSLDTTKPDKWFIRDLVPSSSKNKNWESLQKFKEYLVIRADKRLKEKLAENANKIQAISGLEPPSEIKITVEWKNNRTWGANPTAEAWYPYNNVKSGSIGGCGYDKESTAVAEALNQIPGLIGLMARVKDKPKNIKKYNHEIFGYGSGSSEFPRFEGGVGVSCYYKIFESIGYKLERTASGKTFDCYKATKVKNIR